MKTRLILVAAAALLSACASAPKNLNAQQLAVISPVDMVVVVPQNDLKVDVKASAVSNAGLIGALAGAAIDSARTAHATSKAAPILQAASGHDFRDQLLSALRLQANKPASVQMLPPASILTIGGNTQMKQAAAQARGNSLLITQVTYALVGSELQLGANSRLYARSPAAMAQLKKPDPALPLANGNVLMNKEYRVTRQNITPANIRPMLNEAAQELAQLMADDVRTAF